MKHLLCFLILLTMVIPTFPKACQINNHNTCESYAERFDNDHSQMADNISTTPFLVSDLMASLTESKVNVSGFINLACNYTTYSNHSIVDAGPLTVGFFNITWTKNTTIGIHFFGIKFNSSRSILWVNGSYYISTQGYQFKFPDPYEVRTQKSYGKCLLFGVTSGTTKENVFRPAPANYILLNATHRLKWHGFHVKNISVRLEYIHNVTLNSIPMDNATLTVYFNNGVLLYGCFQVGEWNSRTPSDFWYHRIHDYMKDDPYMIPFEQIKVKVNTPCKYFDVWVSIVVEWTLIYEYEEFSQGIGIYNLDLVCGAAILICVGLIVFVLIVGYKNTQKKKENST